MSRLQPPVLDCEEIPEHLITELPATTAEESEVLAELGLIDVLNWSNEAS